MAIQVIINNQKYWAYCGRNEVGEEALIILTADENQSKALLDSLTTQTQESQS